MMHVLIQAVFWLISVSFAAGTYFHTQATVNQKVLEVEQNSAVNSKILCAMAIEMNVKSAEDICTREIYK